MFVFNYKRIIFYSFSSIFEIWILASSDFMIYWPCIDARDFYESNSFAKYIIFGIDNFAFNCNIDIFNKHQIFRCLGRNSLFNQNSKLENFMVSIKFDFDTVLKGISIYICHNYHFALIQFWFKWQSSKACINFYFVWMVQIWPRAFCDINSPFN